MAQRDSYQVVGTLDPRIEFELTRLIEKEIHYHQKVRDEKLMLERQVDFNMVSCFMQLDPRKNGFIGFEEIFTFMKKYTPQHKMSAG